MDPARVRPTTVIGTLRRWSPALKQQTLMRPTVGEPVELGAWRLQQREPREQRGVDLSKGRDVSN